jgi:hypothetical protein
MDQRRRAGIIMNSLPNGIHRRVVDYLGLFDLVRVSSTCCQLHEHAQEKLNEWEHDFCFERVPRSGIPSGIRVIIRGGANDGATGIVAKDYAPNGNDASDAFRAAGLESARDLPSRHAVVVLEDDHRTAILLPYARLKLWNQELFAYFLRACQEDIGASRALGHCLMERQGGVYQDFAVSSPREGGFWTAFTGSVGDPYSSKLLRYMMSGGTDSAPPRDPPPFRTLSDAENYAHWDSLAE